MIDVMKIQNVSYDVGKINIINNVSFTTKKNEFVSIIGPQGAGRARCSG